MLILVGSGEALHHLELAHPQAVLVLEDGRLAGIMTERDLMRAVARGLRDDAVVGECMTADPDTIAPMTRSSTRPS